MIVHNRGDNKGRLSFEVRQIHPLVHPDLIGVVRCFVVFAELPVRSPAAVGPLDNVYEPLAFVRMISVVVYADQVAVRIEHELMRIA